MQCSCSEMPLLIDVSNASKGFEESLKEIERADWVRLMKCPLCRQLWRVDVWDKYQSQFAVKIFDIEGWANVDTTSLQKTVLLESRGGLQESGTCIRAGCPKKPVKGVVYFIDHLYETGARD